MLELGAVVWFAEAGAGAGGAGATGCLLEFGGSCWVMVCGCGAVRGEEPDEVVAETLGSDGSRAFLGQGEGLCCCWLGAMEQAKGGWL